MKVKDAMARTVTCAAPDHGIDTAAAVMRGEAAGFLPVLDHGRLVGVVTDRDIVLRWLADGGGDPHEVTVGEIMTTDPVAVGPDEELEEAARKMADAEIRRLPVVDGERPVGVLSHGNLVQATAGAGPGLAATIGVTRGA